MLKGNLYVDGSIGGLLRGLGPRKGLLRRLLPGVFQVSRLYAAAPQVLVHGVGAALSKLQGHVVRLAVLYLLFPGHVPLPRGRQDAHGRVHARNAEVETDLVVALAGAAVGHGQRALPMRHLHQVAGDEGAAEGRRQRVLPLVDRPRLQGGPDEVTHKGVFAVHHQSLDRPGRNGPLPDVAYALSASQVHGEGYDLCVVRLLQPGNCDGGIQTAAVGKRYFNRHFLPLLMRKVG